MTMYNNLCEHKQVAEGCQLCLKSVKTELRLPVYGKEQRVVTVVEEELPPIDMDPEYLEGEPSLYPWDDNNLPF